MTTCTRCGHQIDVGRFCTNCGAAVGGSSDTAERPAVPTPSAPPPPPPPLPPAPSAARYPLFADEVGSGQEPAPEPVPLHHPSPAHRGGSGWLVWVVAAAMLVVVALVGATLLLANSDDSERADDPASTGSGGSGGSDPDEPQQSEPAEDSDESDEPPSGDPADVASAATAQVPATGAPGTDVDGDRISYEADQMLDGDSSTCWRMTGDGTGREIVLTLAEPTTVTELGLINGYAKTAQDAKGRKLDWYAGNRRVLAVEWVLDDGTTIPQDLRETRDLQTVELDPVETSTVVLRLVEVSGPGNGRAARDNTAISEISVVGRS
jgi:hypothetical protein